MELDKLVLANAFALSTIVLWVICSVFVWLLPSFSLMITKWWMHGLDVSVMGGWRLSGINFLAGGVSLTITAWITGYIFGWAWEKVS